MAKARKKRRRKTMGRGRKGMYGLGSTKGMHCVRYGRTSGGRRVCRKFSKGGGGGGGNSKKPCVVKSGPKKGKLKKGWRYSSTGRCVRAKSA